MDAYLYEIAKGYGVNWVPEPPTSTSAEEENLSAKQAEGKNEEDGSKKDDEDDGASGGVGERVKEAISVPQEKDTAEPTSAPAQSTPTSASVPAVTKKLTPEEELAQRFERLKNLR